jgi:uncharacterized protein YvpB
MIRRSSTRKKAFQVITTAFAIVVLEVLLLLIIFVQTTTTASSNTLSSTLEVAAKKIDVSLEETAAQILHDIRGTGWRTIDGTRYYYVRGVPATGNLVLDGVSYDFDNEGRWLQSRLDVPYISQLPDMPTGCEVVSVTMMLNYAGSAVTKEEVAAQIPYARDPAVGFTGSLYDWGGYGFGGIMWPSALLELVELHLGSAFDLTQATWSEVTAYIDAGKPVCIWISNWGLEHTVLLTGYSASQVWINDPLANKDVPLALDYFHSVWSQNGYRALSY